MSEVNFPPISGDSEKMCGKIEVFAGAHMLRYFNISLKVFAASWPPATASGSLE